MTAMSLLQVKAARCVAEHLLMIVNGVQTAEDLPLKEGDELYFIEKGRLPSEDEWETMFCARHGHKVYERVKGARVGIAGLGGLGSSIAVALARTGIGYLHLVDFDVVEPSNLNRQQYKIKQLGMLKTDALKMELEEINPWINIRVDTVRVTARNAAQLFEQDDIICEAFDEPEAKAMLVNCLLEGLPGKAVVAASGMAGHESSNTIKTRRIMKNLYVCGDGKTEAKQGRGLMAPRVSICAGHQANMVLRLLLGIKDVEES